MPNHYFQFKQFKIEQEHCAMKVCTDSCLFGAWVVELLQQEKPNNQKTILDIGTGTGLLSLMVAQEIDGAIDAIEIETAAAQQAAENFSNSSYASKLKVIHTDIKLWESNQTYDCIMSNPPFFENDLASPIAKKNLALHSSALNLKELIEIVESKISNEGIVALLLPYHRKEELIQSASTNHLQLYASADIKQTSNHHYFRSFLAFSKKEKTLRSKEIIIQNNRVYTDRFKQLLEKYYLAF